MRGTASGQSRDTEPSRDANCPRKNRPESPISKGGSYRDTKIPSSSKTALLHPHTDWLVLFVQTQNRPGFLGKDMKKIHIFSAETGPFLFFFYFCILYLTEYMAGHHKFEFSVPLSVPESDILNSIDQTKIMLSRLLINNYFKDVRSQNFLAFCCCRNV